MSRFEIYTIWNINFAVTKPIAVYNITISKTLDCCQISTKYKAIFNMTTSSHSCFLSYPAVGKHKQILMKKLTYFPFSLLFLFVAFFWFLRLINTVMEPTVYDTISSWVKQWVFNYFLKALYSLKLLRLFIQQIFFQWLIHADHYPKYWGHSH